MKSSVYLILSVASSLPTLGDYERHMSIILNLWTGPALPRNHWGSALCCLLVIVCFPHSCFLNHCCKGEDPLDIQWAKSVPKVFHVVAIVQDLFVADVINHPKNYRFGDPEVVLSSSVCYFSCKSQDATHHSAKMLNLLPSWILLQPFSLTPPPTTFDVATVSSCEVSDI